LPALRDGQAGMESPLGQGLLTGRTARASRLTTTDPAAAAAHSATRAQADVVEKSSSRSPARPALRYPPRDGVRDRPPGATRRSSGRDHGNSRQDCSPASDVTRTDRRLLNRIDEIAPPVTDASLAPTVAYTPRPVSDVELRAGRSPSAPRRTNGCVRSVIRIATRRQPGVEPITTLGVIGMQAGRRNKNS